MGGYFCGVTDAYFSYWSYSALATTLKRLNELHVLYNSNLVVVLIHQVVGAQ